MTLQNQIKIWAGILLACILALWVFRGILLPFIIGLTLAYLLNPLVNLLQRWRFSRGWATAVVVLVVFGVLVGAFILLVPLVVGQVAGLAQNLPDYVSQLRELGNQWVPAFNEWLGPERALQVETTLQGWLTELPGITANITGQIAQSGLNILSTMALFIVTPVVCFYVLLDWEAMMRSVDDLLPRDHRGEIQAVLSDIDRSMAGVIRGQGSVVLVLCFYYGSALTVSGLSYGLAIGLIVGLLSFIPYVGFIIGFVLSIGVALVQFWPDWFRVVIILVIFGFGQFLEGNVLYPKLVGSSIGINPVWLMFSLFAFALLFGFVGVLLAVPLTAIAGVLTRFAVRKYKSSALYTGDSGDNSPDAAV